MKRFFKILYYFLLIPFIAGQRVDDNVASDDLIDVVSFAYQNNLNVLVEDFTGVG